MILNRSNTHPSKRELKNLPLNPGPGWREQGEGAGRDGI